MVQKSTTHIPLDDLTRISFACDHCRTKIIVDIKQPEQRQTITAGQKQCPVCAYAIKNAIFIAFQHYLMWFDKANDADQSVEFVIDSEA